MFRTVLYRLSSTSSAFLRAKPMKLASLFLASSFVYNYTRNKLVAQSFVQKTSPRKFITTEDEDDGPADWSEDGKKIVTVCVTGAAGALSHSFIPLLANGDVFGPNVKIRLRLLDVPEKRPGLKGIAMELEDGLFPLLENIKIGSDSRKLFKHCDLVVCMAGIPRRRGVSRIDLLKTNGQIYREHGQALAEVAKKDVRCVVVANPANTNCFILQQNAKSVPAENFTCSTRIDQNRTIAQLARKTGLPLDEIQNVVVWGNHSKTIYPDVNSAKLEGKPIRSVVMDDRYLDEELVKTVQDRGDEILEYREHPSVLSGANALKDHIRDWYQGTENTNWFSMGVVSDGSYGVPKGLVFSFPVVSKYFRYKIVKELELDDLSKRRLQTAVEELQKEQKQASQYE